MWKWPIKLTAQLSSFKFPQRAPASHPSSPIRRPVTPNVSCLSLFVLTLPYVLFSGILMTISFCVALDVALSAQKSSDVYRSK